MIDPATRINEQWTVGQLIDAFEDTDFLPFDPNKDHFLCDFCSTGVAYRSKPRVGHYIADNILNTTHPKWRNATASHSDHRPLVPLASYCDDCTTRLLLFPCKGFAEVRLLFTLTEERVVTNPEVTDVSGRDDGIPWDPKELSEQITGVPWEQNALLAAAAGEDQLWGPENMVTFFLSIGSGVDVRELVRWDGSLNPKALGRAHKEYQEFVEKMRRHGHSRRAFRDHVRGEDK
jgi:hypothetical protein